MKTSAMPSSPHTELGVTPVSAPAQVADGTTTPPGSAGAPDPEQSTLAHDVRSSLLLIAATAMFAFAVVALGTLAAGIPA